MDKVLATNKSPSTIELLKSLYSNEYPYTIRNADSADKKTAIYPLCFSSGT